MGDAFEQVPENVQDHIRAIAKDFKMPDTEDSLEAIATAWLEKKSVFEEKTVEADMIDADILTVDDELGALALTYSGSLVNIGPLYDGGRRISYSSIGYRTEIPDSAEKDDANLAKDLCVDDTAVFKNGPVKSTSKIFKIAVCKAELSVEEQEENLSEAVTIIEEEFVEVNKTIMME